MGSKIFEERVKKISPEIKIISKLLLDISDQIDEYLEEKGMTQRDLAKKLGKKEAEISKWMSGSHNFTMLTIAKISAVLERPILTTLLYVDELEERDKEYIVGKLGKSQVEVSSKIEIPFSTIGKQPILLNEVKNKIGQNFENQHLNSDILKYYQPL